MSDSATLSMIAITINGEPRRVLAGLSVAGLVAELGLNPKKVAVERNLEIVPRSTHGEVMIADGDQLEIVHFVGGG
jgi:thiazole synthase